MSNKTNQRDHRQVRSAVISGICVFLTLILCYNLVIVTGLFPGASAEVDENTDILMKAAERRLTVEGQFTDRNGEAITEPGTQGKVGTILFDECYSYLIGYKNNVYGKTGLRRTLYDDLYYGGEDNQGAAVQLTTDNQLQEFCYNQIGQVEGSIIVMKANTGELLALASRSGKLGYNANDVLTVISADEAEAGGVNLSKHEWYDFNGEDGANREDGVYKYMLYNAQPSGYWHNSATKSEDPPGSTFKIVTAAAMIENGYGDYIFEDTDGTWELGGATIRNFGSYSYGTVDMKRALIKSANVYFASGAVAMGGKALWETAQRFLLTENLELDFTTLEPRMMNDKADTDFLTSDVKLAHTGYGQGDIRVTPLNVAMIMAAVMNEGKIMQPYVIQTITDEGVTERDTQPVLASQAMQPDTAATLKKYLHATALEYGLQEDTYGVVYAKTGSAEISGSNHAYILVGVEDTNWGDLVVLVNQAHVDLRGGHLQPILEKVLSYLMTHGPKA